MPRTGGNRLIQSGPPAIPQFFAISRYNFHVPLAEGVMFYNACSGAVVRFDGPDAMELARVLSGRRALFPENALDPSMINRLRRGGFLIEQDCDEFQIIQERFRRARGETPIVLTLTTTMDCNLGCYYCYESRSKHQLQTTDIPHIVELARERLRWNGKRSLHVDWYGGEPLMNLEFLEAASDALQQLCQGEGVAYSASIISNGTCWPEDVGAFITRHRVRQVQISFDGLQANHDKRRRYRKGYAPNQDSSSFDEAITLVDKLLVQTRVDLRFNIDRGNAPDLLPFIDFARDRGWFDAPYPLVFQPARLASYSERSAFMRNWELSVDEFEELRASVRRKIGSDTPIEESEAPDGFPYPRTSVCAALANDSVVVGADGYKYRCGLQVGETHRAVGSVCGDTTGESRKDAEWWQAFDPTTQPNCSRCSFLPICWGGCPKKHLEGDAHAIAEQGYYWRVNLPRLIANGVGERAPANFSYSEADQFR